MDNYTRIIEGLKAYKEQTACKGVVVGISGGKDSTVVAMLLKKVWGDNVVGVIMPNGKQKDLQDALDIVKTLNLKNYVIDIKETVDSIIKSSPVALGDKEKSNIPPRVRMTNLYAIAQNLGYQVSGTSNLSERYIGWTTKWGDSACDFNPIGSITCTMVIELGKQLAKEFGLDEKYIEKAPADGLTGKTDEANFGFTYQKLDKCIVRGFMTETPEDFAAMAKIKKFRKNAEHKQKMPTII